MPNYSGVSSVQPISAGSAAPWQTIKTYTGKQLTSAGGITTVTLETVVTGKSFFITDIFLASEQGSGAQILDCRIQAAGADVFRAPVHNLSPVDMPGLETQPNASSAQQVNLVLPLTTVATNVYFYIAGFEQ